VLGPAPPLPAPGFSRELGQRAVLPLPAKRRGRWGNRSGRSDDPATRRKVRLRGRPNVSVNSQYKPPTGREGGRVAVGVSRLRRAGFTSFIVNEYRHFKASSPWPRPPRRGRSPRWWRGRKSLPARSSFGSTTTAWLRVDEEIFISPPGAMEGFSRLKIFRGGPAGRRAGQNPGGAKNGGDLGAASGDDGPQRATFGYEVMGFGGGGSVLSLPPFAATP
jgi:hypothetical protein